MMSGNRSAAPTRFSASVDGCVASVVSLSSSTHTSRVEMVANPRHHWVCSILLSHKLGQNGVNCVTLVLLISN